jgi:hypothetical protein
MLQGSHGAPLRYHLFILTLWEEDHPPREPVRWRYSLEESRTGVRRGFRSLEELVAYLAAWTQKPSSGDELATPNALQ